MLIFLPNMNYKNVPFLHSYVFIHFLFYSLFCLLDPHPQKYKAYI